MKKTLVLLALLPALAFAQAVQPPDPYFTNSYWSSFDPLNRPMKVSLYAGLNASGPLLPEDAGTVAHVYWDGRHNYVGSPEDITLWTASNATADNVAGGTRVTGTNTTGRYQQNVTVPSGTAFSFAVDASDSTGPFTLAMSCGVGAPTSCTCQGTGCSTSPSGASCIVNYPQVTTIQRVGLSMVCDSARTTVVPYLYGGLLAISAGSTTYNRAQVTLGGFAPYSTSASSVPLDTKGNTWSMNGQVPAVPTGTPFVPEKPGAGPYSAANSYQGPTTLGEWAGDWSVTIVFRPTSLPSLQILAAKRANGAVDGWFCAVTGAGVFYVSNYDGTEDTAATANAVVLNGINVATCGRSGGTVYARLNGGAGVSVASGTMVAATSEPIRIGRYGGAAFQSAGISIHEIIASTTPYSDALHADRFARVFGHYTGQGGTITVARADPLTYTANGFVWSAPPATLATESAGVAIWKGATNYALNSDDLSAAAGWTIHASATLTPNQCAGLDGQVTMDRLASAVDNYDFRNATVTSSTGPFTMSAAMRSFTGTQTQRLEPTCGAVNVAACTCGRSDGGSCTITTPSATACTAEFTNLTTTPIRGWATYTCASAITAPIAAVRAGPTGAAGDGCFGNVQLEASAYPTPYIPTAAAATPRAATVATVPLPALGDRFCVAATLTPGQAWNAGAFRRALSNSQGATTNTFSLVATNTQILWDTYDSAGGNKIVTWTHGYGATTTGHRVTGCYNQGAPSMCADGVPVGSVSGAGAGTMTTTPTPLYIGSIIGTSQFDGNLSNVKICKGATKCSDCR